MNILSYFLPAGLCLSVSLGHPDPVSITPQPRFSKTFYRLGDRLLTLEKAGRVNEPRFTIVSWQEGSALLREQAATFAQANEGRFLHLDDTDPAGIEVELLSRKLRVHPDRIFTYEGQRQLLRDQDCWKRSTFFAVQKFSRFLMDEIFTSGRVVLLSPGSTQDRLQDFEQGGRKASLAKDVHAGKARIGEGFVLTSDESLFHRLKERDLPVVLLSKTSFPDNGSLMKFCLRRNISLVQLVSNDADPQVLQQWLEVISG